MRPNVYMTPVLLYGESEDWKNFKTDIQAVGIRFSVLDLDDPRLLLITGDEVTPIYTGIEVLGGTMDLQIAWRIYEQKYSEGGIRYAT